MNTFNFCTLYFREKNALVHLLCKLWNADDLNLNHNGSFKICIDKALKEMSVPELWSSVEDVWL